MSLPGLYPSSKLRERVATKFGCNGKTSQSHPPHLFDGAPPENFSSPTAPTDPVPLLMLAWRIFWSSSCLSLFVFSPEQNGYRPSATGLAQKLPFFVFTSVEGKGTPLPFGVPPPIIWLHFSPSPSDVRRPKVT